MALLTAVIVVATLIAMTSGRIPPVLALIIALLVAGLTGIAPPAKLFAGLSNGGVLTIAAMLVIAKGVLATGVISRLTFRLLNGMRTASQTLLRLIPPVGVISSLINTTPIVAMLIPATKELQQRSGIPARSVLLPIAHATTLAGSMTLIGTSSNLIIAGMAARSDIELTMFSFVPIAAPVAVVGWIAIVLTSRRLLKSKPRVKEKSLDWRAELPVSGRSVSIGRTAEEIGIAETVEYELIGIRRWGRTVVVESPLEEDDVLIYRCTEAGIRMLWSSPRFGLAPHHLFAVTLDTQNPGSVRDLQDDEDLIVVAAETERRFRDTPMRPGSTVYVSAASREVLDQHPYVGLWQNVAGKAPQPGKTWAALGILLAVIVGASFGIAPVELVAGTGAVAMVMTGILTPRSAVRALDWNILAIIAGSIGLGVMVIESGLGDHISDGIVHLSAGSIPVMVAVLALGTTLLTNFVTNAAAASILTPVAVAIAHSMSLDPTLLLILVGTCISFTFLNPYSHQSNLMVMEPGGYTTTAFLKFGIPLTLVSVITAFAVTWPLLALRS
ncbi:MAG: SLC13 family permease [Gordonia sp. (in: high G+C Gram-positive bacteria)]|uniref:SLC13 family permease n=1 Tax=Gordonia sp. (in: high G+C Gram-positive bacteria) TaxID=84139 RepID=UPI0039E3B4F1